MQINSSLESTTSYTVPVSVQKSGLVLPNDQPIPAGLLKKRYISHLNLKEPPSKDFRIERSTDASKELNAPSDEEVISTGTIEFIAPAAPAAADPLKFTECRVDRAVGNLDQEYLAKAINPEEIKVLDGSNYRVYDQLGNLLVVYVKNVVDLKKHDAVLANLYAFSEDTSYFHSASRGAAAGTFDSSHFPNKDPSKWKVRKNGLKATYEEQTFTKSNPHKSGSVGYLGHNVNGSNKCRTVRMGDTLLPSIELLLNDIAEIYQKHVPAIYEAQLKSLEDHRVYAKEHNKFHGQIGKTPFTTMVINASVKDKPTTYAHYDKGNLNESFVALFVDGGNYSGGETAFPQLRDPETKKMIAFSVQPGDLLLFDGKKLLHGNTPVKLLHLLADRVSFVAFAQATLASCKRCGLEEEKKPAKKLGARAIERAQTKRDSYKSLQPHL